MGNKQLLIEHGCGHTITIEQDILTESVGSDGVYRLVVKALLQRANALNRNGRVYPFDVLNREVKKYQELVDESNSFAELDHPESASISLRHDAVSHLVKSMWWEGDALYGTLEIITSPGYVDHGGLYCAGDHIANMLKRSYKIGLSSRGLGSVKNIGGKNIVQNDFELIGFDLVSSPSTKGGYLSYDPNGLVIKEETTKSGIIINSSSLDKTKLQKFLNK